jgi:hypothetical protein
MSWDKVGGWLKDNGSSLLKLAGAVATGNAPAGIAAVASMVTEATGETNPARALTALQGDPVIMAKLEEIAKRDEADIRLHHREMHRVNLEDQQQAHKQQQDTIRSGDTASDTYVRHTRPGMARKSWTATVAYCIGCFGVEAITGVDLFNTYLAGVLSAPAWAYLGFRTADKFALRNQ